MKEIIDTIVIVMFVIILFGILRGFNKQQIEKHKSLLEEAQKKREEKKKEDI
jgi:uncharacterized protein YxeA